MTANFVRFRCAPLFVGGVILVSGFREEKCKASAVPRL
jgi:hypothetical protein